MMIFKIKSRNAESRITTTKIEAEEKHVKISYQKTLHSYIKAEKDSLS